MNALANDLAADDSGDGKATLIFALFPPESCLQARLLGQLKNSSGRVNRNSVWMHHWLKERLQDLHSHLAVITPGVVVPLSGGGGGTLQMHVFLPLLLVRPF